MELGRSDFPDDFLLGVSTSAYQIEGHGQGGAGRTHWDDFAATPGNVVRGENGARACDHLNRFGDDLDLVQGLGADAYRFSISWARVLPEGRGTPNRRGLDFYDRLVDAMLSRGLKPFATLYHWELPSALADLGGWRNRDIAGWFADYTEVVMDRLGDRLHAAAPINEPWCVAWLSHYLGQHAPGLRDIRGAIRAMHHVGLAHGRSIAAMRARGMTNLGAVTNHEAALPMGPSDEAVAAAKLYDGIYNRWFLGGIYNGVYPSDVLAHFEPYMPQGWQDDMAVINAPVDWAGVNYYTRKLISPGPSGHFADLVEGAGDRRRTSMGWEVYPEGLSHMLRRVSGAYARNLPIYVTENGMSAPDRVRNTKVADPHRIRFLNEHLAVVKAAREAGIDVRGYFIWSLLDNYEWALGYEKRFGLVHVDFKTLKRTPKASWHALKAAWGQA
ncbi:MAG: GH1 family beta-glucosidase [Pseudomonadota bacterium]